MCGCVCLCLSARLRSYVTKTAEQTMLGTVSPFTCLSASNLQQSRTETVRSLQFIFRSCHLFVESSGFVWGGWEAGLFHMHSKLHTWIRIIILTCFRCVCGGGFTQGFACTCWQSQEYRSAFSDFNTPPPSNLLTVTPPRHPFRANLTCTRVHSRMHIHTAAHVTDICVTMPASAHTRPDTFIHKLIRRVDLPATIHHTVTQAGLGTVWQQHRRREVPGI